MTNEQMERAIETHDRQIGEIAGAIKQLAEIQLNQSGRMEQVLSAVAQTASNIDRLEVMQAETADKLNGLIDLFDRMIRERGESK